MSCTTGFVARSLIPDLLKIVGVSASVFLGSAALSGAIARADGVDEAGRIADILFDAQPSQPGLLYPDDETVTAMSEALAELGHEPSAETAFALRLLAQGDARPILTVLEERLAQDPDDEDALFDQGAVYGAYAPRKMLEAYGRALKLDATNVLAWARVFENRLFAGDTDGWKAALAALETLAASDPQARRVVAWKSCRADYQRNQNFENAESECRTAIAAAREANDWTVIGGASADLAYVLLELGRASEAREVAANVADELEAAGQPRAGSGLRLYRRQQAGRCPPRSCPGRYRKNHRRSVCLTPICLPRDKPSEDVRYAVATELPRQRLCRAGEESSRAVP